MKSNRIIAALGDIDEKYIAEAAPSECVATGSKVVMPKPLVWRFAPVAACAAIAVVAVLIVGQNGFFQNATPPVADNNMIVAQNDLSEQGAANDIGMPQEVPQNGKIYDGSDNGSLSDGSMSNTSPALIDESQVSNGTDGLFIPADGVSFTGVVEEIREGSAMLVRVDEDDPFNRSADLIWVDFIAVEIVPSIRVGDRVAVLFNGNIDESYPAQISALDVVKDGEPR